MLWKLNGKMRKLKLQGASIFKDNNGTSSCWRVRLGKTFTGGAPIKKSFHSYADAAQWLRDQEKARAEHGRGAFLMSDAEVAEAQDAFMRLGEAAKRTGTALSLTKAVSFFLQHGAPKGGRMSVQDVVTGWITEKATTKSTLHGVRSVLDRFAEEFGTRPINELMVKDCQRFLDGLKVEANSKIHYAKDLATVFEWAAKPGRQWLHENPWHHVTLPKKTPVEIGILRPSQAGALLTAAAAQEDAPLLGSLVLGLFGGLRTAERARLDWSAVRLNGRALIEIRAKWAKTSARRTVELCPAAVEWLQMIPKREGRMNPRNAEGRFATLCKTAGVVCPRNGLRHSYASYRYAAVRDAAAVAADLGHDNLRTLKRHYVDVVTPEAAVEYFGLRPGLRSAPQKLGTEDIESGATMAKSLNDS